MKLTEGSSTHYIRGGEIHKNSDESRFSLLKFTERYWPHVYWTFCRPYLLKNSEFQALSGLRSIRKSIAYVSLKIHVFQVNVRERFAYWMQPWTYWTHDGAGQSDRLIQLVCGLLQSDWPFYLYVSVVEHNLASIVSCMVSWCKYLNMYRISA